LGFTGTHKLIGHLGFFAGMSSSTKLGTDANFSARKSILPLEVTKALLQSKHHSWISPLCSDQLRTSLQHLVFRYSSNILQVAWRCCSSVTASRYCRSSFTQLAKEQLHCSGCNTRAGPVCVQIRRIVWLGLSITYTSIQELLALSCQHLRLSA